MIVVQAINAQTALPPVTNLLARTSRQEGHPASLRSSCSNCDGNSYPVETKGRDWIGFPIVQDFQRRAN